MQRWWLHGLLWSKGGGHGPSLWIDKRTRVRGEVDNIEPRPKIVRTRKNIQFYRCNERGVKGRGRVSFLLRKWDSEMGWLGELRVRQHASQESIVAIHRLNNPHNHCALIGTGWELAMTFNLAKLCHPWKWSWRPAWAIKMLRILWGIYSGITFAPGSLIISTYITKEFWHGLHLGPKPAYL